MKRISYLITLTLLTSLIITSCNDTSYAQELKTEKILIADYIKRNNINVLKNKPADNVYGKNDYWLTESGLYFHLVSPGTGTDTLELYNRVVPRFIQTTLTEIPDTIRNWTILDLPHPLPFVYGVNASVCLGFQEAVSYMKRNESEAKIIVPSKIGFTKYYYGLNGNSSDGTFDYMTTVTPMAYDLKILIQK